MPDFTIRVPSTLTDDGLVRFFRGWKWWNDIVGTKVIIDWSQCGYVAPWVPTLFASYGLWLKSRGFEVENWIDDDSQVGRHLSLLGYQRLFDEEASIPSGGGRMLPLTLVRSSKDVAPTANQIVTVLEVEDEEIRDAMRYSIIELLRNVVQHSRCQVGGLVSAVHYRDKGLVEITIVDHGCGIRTALREKYPEISSDLKAVKFAIQPHVSGTFESGAYSSMMNNAGLGLFFIKEIVSRGTGGFFLASGEQMVNAWGDESGCGHRRYFKSSEGGWRGTAAVVQFRSGRIEEFDALLQVCRDIAGEVRKDPSEQRLDFIDEDPELEEAVNIRVSEFDEDVDEAARVREEVVFPALEEDGLVLLHFDGIRAATQSFVHALMYRVIRDGKGIEKSLIISGADSATREAVRTVAAYAKVESPDENEKD